MIKKFNTADQVMANANYKNAAHFDLDGSNIVMPDGRADTTMIPFTEFRAGDLGVDVEVVSSTKYISGGATSLGGLVIDYGTFPEVNNRIRNELLFNIGGYMTPHAAYSPPPYALV